MKPRTFLLLCCLIMIVLFPACNKDKPGEQLEEFNRAAMLENYAVNVIRPAYQDLLDEADALRQAWSAFSNEAGEARLLALRSQWLETALAWQSANGFNFGPAGEDGVRKSLLEEIGTFPVAVEKVENFIAAGDASLNNFDRDSRGILAIEYLVYGSTGEIQEVLTNLENDNRRLYLEAVINDLYDQVERVVSEWVTFQNEFIANEGTDVGSSTSLLYNEFVRSYEAAKNFKVGLPAGKRAGQTQAEPQLVEAYFSGKSRELLTAHLNAIDRIYYGAGASGSDGVGFFEYLQAVEGGPALTTSTIMQWQSVLGALSDVPAAEPFSELIEKDDPSVTDLHTEMQKQIRFFKSDMSSLLGIAITFNSGDGD